MLHRAQKTLKNRWQRTKSNRDWKRWRVKANEYSNAIARAKAKHWQEFVQALDGESIWDVMRYLSQTATQTVIPALGETAETHEEIANTLQQTFFPQPPPPYLTDL